MVCTCTRGRMRVLALLLVVALPLLARGEPATADTIGPIKADPVPAEPEECLSDDARAAMIAELTKTSMEALQAKDFPTATSMLEQALKEARKMNKTEGAGVDVLTSTLQNLGELYFQLRDQRALPVFQEVLSRVVKVHPEEHEETARVIQSIAEVYRGMGEHETSLDLFRRVLFIRRKINKVGDLALIKALNNLAGAYHVMGNHKKALPRLKEAHKMAKEHLPRTHPDHAQSYNNLGAVWDSYGNPFKAMNLYEEALVIARETLPADHDGIMTALENLANLYYTKGSFKKSLPYYEEVLEIARRRNISYEIANALQGVGYVQFQLEEFEKSEEVLAEAAEVRRQGGGAEDPALPSLLMSLGSLRLYTDDYEEAVKLFEEAIELFEARFEPDDLVLANAYDNLAGAYRAVESYDKSVQTYKDALEIRKKKLKPDDPAIKTTLENIANVYKPFTVEAPVMPIPRSNAWAKAAAMQAKADGADMGPPKW